MVRTRIRTGGRKPDLVAVLADAFSRRVRHRAGSDLPNLVHSNGTRRDENYCASHEFMDANALMAASFLEVVGREVRLGEAGDEALWRRAWERARDNSFGVRYGRVG